MSGKIQRKPFKKSFHKGHRPYGKPFKPFGTGYKKNGKKFLENAKGFGKKGNFGRGTHIEQDDFQYFIGILESLRKRLDYEEKTNMGNNVLEQTKDKEIHLMSNQIASKAIELVVGYADAEHLERYFEIFGANFRPVCSDLFASHVLEKVIETAFLRAVAPNKIEDEENGEKEDDVAPKRQKFEITTDCNYNMTNDFTEEHRTNCSNFLIRVSKFLLNNLEDFVWDICGTHLIRKCITSLAGVHIPRAQQSKGYLGPATNSKYVGSKFGHHKGIFVMKEALFKVPDEWVELVKEFPSRLEMWPQFPELPYKEKSSGLVGIICVAFSYLDKNILKHFGKKLLSEAFIDVKIPKTYSRPKAPLKANKDEENGEESDEEREENDEEKEENDSDEEEEEEKDEEEEDGSSKDEDEDDDRPSVFKTESSIRLLETLMSVAGPKLLTEIYNKLFAGRIVELAKDQYTNFPVQRLLNYIKDKTIFDSIFDKLIEHMQAFLELGTSGLVSALSGACLRLNSKQAAFIAALQNTLHCTTAYGEDRPKSFFTCLLKMKPVEVLPYDKKNYVVIYGSLIVQDILQYNKPIFLVNCILETPPNVLFEILHLPNGCHIADAFLKSKFVGEKSREKFIKLLEGFYMDLSLSKSGSRVVEKLLGAANEAQKVRIAKELTTKENKLQTSIFGRIIYNTLRLETFKLSPDQWKASWVAKPKKEEEVSKSIGKKKKKRAAS